MALTQRTNGSGSANIIQAAWWNDYYNLFTGAMSDQPIHIANSVQLIAPAAPSSGLTCALSNASANLGVGTYTYNYTFCNADYAESPCSANTQITTNSSNKQVNLSNIQTGPSG